MRIALAGALGEVGTALDRALCEAGHTVLAVSERAPLADRPDVISLAELDLDGIDLVVNAAGRGDRRPGGRTGLETAQRLAEACRAARTPAVLISTTRVLEGAAGQVSGDDPAMPTSTYGQGNAALEQEWLSFGDTHVLRLANFLCRPASASSPQAGLLPWSLVTEALRSGSISVRSAPSVWREFVDASDVVHALPIVLQSGAPRTVAMLPGARLSMADLVEAVGAAFVGLDLPRPEVRFGSDTAEAPQLQLGWLARQGWHSEVTVQRVAHEVATWVRAATYTDVPTADAPTGGGEQ